MADQRVAQATVTPEATEDKLDNRDPVAVDDCAITAGTTPIHVPVLANDHDPDGDLLTPAVIAPPAHGEAAVNPDGTITYTPSGEAGRDALVYQVRDGLGGTAEANLFVLINPEPDQPAPAALENLDDETLSSLVQACATAATALAVVELRGTEVVVAPPEPGERVEVEVVPGQSLTLQGPEFAAARYIAVDEGMLVMLPDGRIVFLAGFAEAAASDNPPLLAVAGRPAVAADQLLARLESDVEPAFGPEHDGGAAFTPYDPGAIGPGLDPLGPLGPTALALGVAPEEPEALPLGDDEADDGLQPVTNQPPSIDGTPSRSAFIDIFGESRGHDYSTAFVFPELAEGQAVPASEARLVDMRNLVLPETRDAEVIFVSTGTSRQNVLGVYLIDADGTLREPRIVFEDTGVVPPGTTVRLSEVYADAAHLLEPGTRFAFFLIADGVELNPDIDFTTGSLQFLVDERPALFTDDEPPVLVHTDPSGDVRQVVVGDIFHTADDSPSTVFHNAQNPGEGLQAISGLEPEVAGLTIGFDDVRVGHPYGAGPADRDFNDAVFRVKFPPVTERGLVDGPAPVAEDLTITDPDDAELVRATVEITSGRQAGDVLGFDGLVIGPGGVIAGTSITVVEDGSDGRLVLEGRDEIATYEAVLRSVTFDSAEPSPGIRQISFQVEDPHGAVSNVFAVDLGVGAVLPDGTLADQTLVGSDGDDALTGGDGNDVLIGGDGDDVLMGGPGDDVLYGGVGADELHGGPGADRFLYTSLDDRGDRIMDFNADEGDRLVVDDLLRGFDPATSDIEDFLFLGEPDAGGNRVVSVDVDGPGGDFGPIPLLTLVQPTGVDTVADLVGDTATA